MLRNTAYLSCMKKVNKRPRNTRTYKVTDLVYNKARKVAKRKKESLATVIESWVKEYSEGNSLIASSVLIVESKSNK